jgi:hypothetical protein
LARSRARFSTSLRLKHRTADIVLAGDQLQAIALAARLTRQDSGDIGIIAPERW